ncbi:MAG: ABC transporter permease [Beijerinckiaceae bacterium]
MKKSMQEKFVWLLPAAMVVLFFVGWTWYVRAYNISRFILPEPLSVVRAFVKLLQEPGIWGHVWLTVYETLSGFFLAIVVGVFLGVIMGKVRLLEIALKPFVIATQVVPKIALVPLFILWFGFGPESKIVIAAVLSFFPIFSNTMLGIKSIDRGYREVMTTFRSNSWQRFRFLELPSALPYILTGMEIGIVLAIIGAIVGEFIGANKGLGYLAVATLQELQVDTLFGVILLLALIGLTMYFTVVMLRRLLVPWHESAMRTYT